MSEFQPNPSPSQNMTNIGPDAKEGEDCHYDNPLSDGNVVRGDEPGLFKQEARSRLVSRRPSVSANNDSNARYEFHRVPTMRNLKVSEGIDVFNIEKFIKHLVYHSCYPLTIPLVILVEGWNRTYNLAFLPTYKAATCKIFIVQLSMALLFWAMIACQALNDDPPDTIFLVIPTALYFTHKLMIASKYAVLDDGTHEWLGSTVIERRILESIELHTWRKLNENEILQQLKYAAERRGIDIYDIHFYLYKDIYREAEKVINVDEIAVDIKGAVEPGQKATKCEGGHNDGTMRARATRVVEHKSKTGRGNESDKNQLTDAVHEKGMNRCLESGSELKRCVGTEEANPINATAKRRKANFKAHNGECNRVDERRNLSGLVKIKAIPIATRIVALSLTDYSTTWHECVIWAISIAQACIPVIMSLGWRGAVGNNSALTLIQVCFGWFLTCMYFYVALMFIDVGRHDNIRRARIVQAAGALIDVDSPLFFPKWYATLFVDLAWPQNISAWVKLRWLLLNIGGQFRTRITIYSSYVTIFLLALVLYVIAGSGFTYYTIKDVSLHICTLNPILSDSM